MKYLKVFETDTDQQNYINGEFDRPNITIVRHKKQSINYIAKLPPPKLISFTIDDITYNALEGMTFMEWCESPYNIDGFRYEPISSSEYRFATSDGDYISINRTWVEASSIIQKDGKYIVGLYKLITFYIDEIEYQSEAGMTWGQWVDSKYDVNEKFYIDFDNSVGYNKGRWVGTEYDYVFAPDIIQENYYYLIVM